jgi:hypothetical protein
MISNTASGEPEVALWPVCFGPEPHVPTAVASKPLNAMLATISIGKQMPLGARQQAVDYLVQSSEIVCPVACNFCHHNINTETSNVVEEAVLCRGVDANKPPFTSWTLAPPVPWDAICDKNWTPCDAARGVCSAPEFVTAYRECCHIQYIYKCMYLAVGHGTVLLHSCLQASIV